MSSGATTARKPTAAPTPTGSWLTLAAGRRVTNLSVYSFFKAVALGKIRVEAKPGCAPRYNSKDCQRLAAEREATAGA